MANYIDCQLTRDKQNSVKHYSDTISVMLAIKNLLIGAPGNWPMDPKMGIDIGQFAFEFADNTSLEMIKRKVRSQVNKYIPNDNGITTDVALVKDSRFPDRYKLGITISGHLTNADKSLEIRMLVAKDKGGNISVNPV